MAFFGVTYHGLQHSLREGSVQAKEDPARGGRQLGWVALPPIRPKDPPARAILPTSQTAGWGPGYEGSFAEYSRMRTKHVRNPVAPQQLHYQPPSTAAEPGWWTRDTPLHAKHPWTHVPRQPRINSEMTNFVDTMLLTNKQYSHF